MTENPQQEQLEEIVRLLLELPGHFIPTIDFIYRDDVGGYGWHRVFVVAIYEVGKKCRKCGNSTLHKSFPDDFLENHRHSWKRDAREVFRRHIGLNCDEDINMLRYFVDKAKNNQL